MLRKISYYGLLIGTVVFFALFFFYPVFQVLKGGLRDSEGKLTFFYLAEVFRNPIYLEGLLNSVKIAICSTLVAVLISLPLAWLSDRFEFAGKVVIYIADTGCNIRKRQLILCVQLDIITAALNLGGQIGVHTAIVNKVNKIVKHSVPDMGCIRHRFAVHDILNIRITP